MTEVLVVVDHVNHFTASSLTHLASRAGFEIESKIGVTSPRGS